MANGPTLMASVAQNGATAAVQDDSRPGWEHANDICRTAGGRLCTVAELLNEVTRGTGCQHDAEMTWSSEPCDHWGITGHITAQGGQHRGDEACPDECHGNGWSTGGNSAGQDCATCECTPRCAPDDNTHAVRCCADADPTEAKAKCEAYIGYKGQLKNPPPASNTMDEIGREATTTAASALCQSSSSCYELQGLFGGWPVGATSDQIRAGQVTNAAGGYTHGGSQGYSTSGFNGNNNHLERHESGVCGESDNGLGEADEQGKRTNQCFGGEGGASNRAHLFRSVSRATLTLWCAAQAARSHPCPSPLATAIIGARGLPAPRTNTISAAGGTRSRSASPSDPGCARWKSYSRRTRATPAATTTAKWSGPRRQARPAARTSTSWRRAVSTART